MSEEVLYRGRPDRRELRPFSTIPVVWASPAGPVQAVQHSSMRAVFNQKICGRARGFNEDPNTEHIAPVEIKDPDPVADWFY